jgi:hypothetical protein
MNPFTRPCHGTKQLRRENHEHGVRRGAGSCYRPGSPRAGRVPHPARPALRVQPVADSPNHGKDVAQAIKDAFICPSPYDQAEDDEPPQFKEHGVAEILSTLAGSVNELVAVMEHTHAMRYRVHNRPRKHRTTTEDMHDEPTAGELEEAKQFLCAQFANGNMVERSALWTAANQCFLNWNAVWRAFLILGGRQERRDDGVWVWRIPK